MNDNAILGVVGGGTMGAGIAQAAAQAGVSVIVVEKVVTTRERAAATMQAAFTKAQAQGLLDAPASDVAARVRWTDNLGELAAAGIVIEAIPEIREAKAGLFAELDAICSATTVVATNTSSIPIAELASGTANPDRVIGLHFFNPVPRMPLVEVIPSLLTDPSVTDQAEGFLRNRMQKQTIRAKDQAGFVVNAIFVPYLLSAIRAFENAVASAEDIDQGMVGGCGMPMGPLALCDLIGLDTMLLVADSLHAEYQDAATIAPPILRRHVDAGWLGRKSGRGFYDYAPAQKG